MMLMDLMTATMEAEGGMDWGSFCFHLFMISLCSLSRRHFLGYVHPVLAICFSLFVSSVNMILLHRPCCAFRVKIVEARGKKRASSDTERHVLPIKQLMILAVTQHKK